MYQNYKNSKSKYHLPDFISERRNTKDFRKNVFYVRTKPLINALSVAF